MTTGHACPVCVSYPPTVTDRIAEAGAAHHDAMTRLRTGNYSVDGTDRLMGILHTSMTGGASWAADGGPFGGAR